MPCVTFMYPKQPQVWQPHAVCAVERQQSSFQNHLCGTCHAELTETSIINTQWSLVLHRTYIAFRSWEGWVLVAPSSFQIGL